MSVVFSLLESCGTIIICVTVSPRLRVCGVHDCTQTLVGLVKLEKTVLSLIRAYFFNKVTQN